MRLYKISSESIYHDCSVVWYIKAKNYKCADMIAQYLVNHETACVNFYNVERVKRFRLELKKYIYN